MGKNMTGESQIRRRMKQYFPNQYRGIFTPNKIPKLRRNEIAIVFEGPNHAGHWRTVYNKNGTLYEYDSYGRDAQGSRYKDARAGGNKQKQWEANCGQRTIAHLIKVFKS